jgi:hypothetical protein
VWSGVVWCRKPGESGAWATAEWSGCCARHLRMPGTRRVGDANVMRYDAPSRVGSSRGVAWRAGDAAAARRCRAWRYCRLVSGCVRLRACFCALARDRLQKLIGTSHRLHHGVMTWVLFRPLFSRARGIKKIHAIHHFTVLGGNA